MRSKAENMVKSGGKLYCKIKLENCMLFNLEKNQIFFLKSDLDQTLPQNHRIVAATPQNSRRTAR